MLLEQERRDVCVAARTLAERGLARSDGGTVSIRSGDHVTVSPAGVPLDRVEPADCPVLSLEGGVVEGRRGPAAETTLHMAIYQHGEADTRAAVHAHMDNAAAVSAALAELPPVHHSAALLGGAIPVTRYATYGTGELSDHAVKALSGKSAALLANHGGVATGTDVHQALGNAQLLEWLCGVYIRAASLGPPRVLTEEELAETRQRGTYDWAGPDIL